MLGCGTVGSGFLKIFEKKGYQVLGILVRDTLRYPHLGKKVTDDFEKLMALKPDVLVETMGGITKAYEYITYAIERGVNVVTANKDLMALHGKSLIDLALKHGVNLRFEASTLGGIPILTNLNTYFKEDGIQCLEGIFNGTSNYILTQMNKGNTFDASLEKAQSLGYAESNPESDTKGYDIARKVSVLIQTCFQGFVSYDRLPKYDLNNLESSWFQFAKDHAYKVKLIAMISKSDGLKIGLEPFLVKEESEAYGVDGVRNYVSLYSEFCGKSTLIGEGAGQWPSGYGVFHDVIHIQNNNLKPLSNMAFEVWDEPSDFIITKTSQASKLDVQIIDDQYALIRNIKASVLKALSIDYIRIKRNIL